MDPTREVTRFILVMALILGLEHLWPVRKDQASFSSGFLRDSVWFLLGAVSTSLVFIWTAKGLTAHFTLPSITALTRIPLSVRLILAVLAADFLACFQHRLQHRLPWLWRFHELHHNQTEVNPLTSSRIHFVDYFMMQFFSLAPFILLGIETSYIVLFRSWVAWQTRFYHANIRSNMGFLRFVFVTPQSHRIHHSLEEGHRDKNFGVIFSFWDRFFGTQHESCSDYPPVGVKNPEMPLESGWSFSNALWIPLWQLSYPFLAIVRRLRAGTRFPST